MKIDLDSQEGTSSSGFETTAMRVDSSKEAKLFHMLSSSLYTNKFRSIIRELCSNAYDSHVMLGDPNRPIKIIAPTYKSPNLIIEDSGVGLSTEKAMRTIFCYLGSDKDTSDEFVGGWGIGAKSPFSYTSSYEISITYDGIRSSFTCWKDEHGLPKNSVTGVEPTYESNGVTVTVPIEIEDITDCLHQLNIYATFCNYNLDIVGLDDYEKQQPLQVIDFKNFELKVFPYASGNGYDKDILVSYGGYTYEDFSDIINDGTDYYTTYNSVVSCLQTNTYTFVVTPKTINCMNFTMSRESIEATPKSKQYLQSVISEIALYIQSIYGSIRNELNEFANKKRIEFTTRLFTLNDILDVSNIITSKSKESWMRYSLSDKDHWSSIYAKTDALSELKDSSGRRLISGLFNTEINLQKTYKTLLKERTKTRGKYANDAYKITQKENTLLSLDVFRRIEKQVVIVYSKYSPLGTKSVYFHEWSEKIEKYSKIIFIKEDNLDATKKIVQEIFGIQDVDFLNFISLDEGIMIAQKDKEKPTRTTRKDYPTKMVCRISGWSDLYSQRTTYINTNTEYDKKYNSHLSNFVTIRNETGNSRFHLIDLANSFTKKWKDTLSNVISVQDFIDQKIEWSQDTLNKLPVDLNNILKATLIYEEMVSGERSFEITRIKHVDTDACTLSSVIDETESYLDDCRSYSAYGAINWGTAKHVVNKTLAMCELFNIPISNRKPGSPSAPLAEILILKELISRRYDKFYKYLKIDSILKDMEKNPQLLAKLKELVS